MVFRIVSYFFAFLCPFTALFGCLFNKKTVTIKKKLFFYSKLCDAKRLECCSALQLCHLQIYGYNGLETTFMKPGSSEIFLLSISVKIRTALNHQSCRALQHSKRSAKFPFGDFELIANKMGIII